MSAAEPTLSGYDFGSLAPAGYYLAVRVGFAFPEFEHNALPLGWVHTYAQEGLVMQDPVMRWVYEHNGSVRWSDLQENDRRGVLSRAATFGLNFGVTICISGDEGGGLRSFGTFCRSDREFSEAEIAQLEEEFARLNRDSSPPSDVTEAEIEALSLIQDGLLVKEAAFQLDISEGAFKKRLRGAKSKLGARTTAHAVAKAASFGLI